MKFSDHLKTSEQAVATELIASANLAEGQPTVSVTRRVSCKDACGMLCVGNFEFHLCWCGCVDKGALKPKSIRRLSAFAGNC